MITHHNKKAIASVFGFFCLSVLFILFCLLATAIFTYAEKPSSLGAEASTLQADRMTIVIDAGHGGEDSGAVGISGVLEKDLNLSIAKMLADIFSLGGYEVILTRNEDKLLYDPNDEYEGRKKVLDLQNRLSIANDCGCNLFLSIHMNSFPNPNYQGFTVYYSPVNKDSEIIAKEIYKTVKNKLNKDNRRSVLPSNGNIYLLDRASYPAVLLECGFISSEEDCKRLTDEEYLKKLSLLIFSAIHSATS